MSSGARRQVRMPSQKCRDAVLIFFRLDGAGGVLVYATGAYERRRRIQQFVLEHGQLRDGGFGALPAQVRPLGEDAQARARRIQEHTIRSGSTVVLCGVAKIGRRGLQNLDGMIHGRVGGEPETRFVHIEGEHTASILHERRSVERLAPRRCTAIDERLTRLWIEQAYDEAGALILHGAAPRIEPGATQDGLQLLHPDEIVEPRRGLRRDAGVLKLLPESHD